MTTVEPPARLSGLRPFLDLWALPTEDERSRRRWASSPEEFQSFYDAVLPLLDDLLGYIDGYELGGMPELVLPYYWLALAFAEVAPHVEMYHGAVEVPNSFPAYRLAATGGNQRDY